MNSTVKTNENSKDLEKDKKINENEGRKKNSMDDKSIAEESFHHKILNLFSQKKDLKGSLNVHIQSNLFKSPYTISIEKSEIDDFEDNVIKSYYDFCVSSNKEDTRSQEDYLSNVTSMYIESSKPYDIQISVLPNFHDLKNLISFKIEHQAIMNVSLNWLKFFPHLKSFEIIDCKVKTITFDPVDSEKFQKIERISLADNSISAIPPSLFSAINSIISLDLSNNSILNLPEEIGLLTNLEELLLLDNPIVELPQSITKLSKLKRLSIGGPQMKLPFIAKKNILSNLQNHGLMSLTLSRTNSLTEIPSSLITLTRIETLNLGQNKISNLPNEVSTLTNLQKLILKGNHLKSFPQMLLNMEHIKYLDLSNNSIDTIPSEVSHLSQLEYLDLSKNSIVSIEPHSLYLKKLVHLNISNNQINCISNNELNLPSLEYLDASSNLIQVFSLNLSLMDKIKFLSLENNKINSLQTITHLKEIETLNIKNTNIFVLPKKFSNLKIKNLIIGNLSIYINEDNVIKASLLNDSCDCIKQLISLCASSEHIMLIYGLYYLTKPEIYSNETYHQLFINSLTSEGCIDLFIQLSESFHNEKPQLLALKAIKNITKNIDNLDSFNAEVTILPHIHGIFMRNDSNYNVLYISQGILCNLSQSPKLRQAINKDKTTEKKLLELMKNSDEKTIKDIKLTLATIGIHHLRDSNRGIRILALDGGGTRGIVSVRILMHLENLIKKPIHELFDLVVGTSTGSLIAILTTVKKKKAEEILPYYKELCKIIFTPKGVPTTNDPLSLLANEGEVYIDTKHQWGLSLPFQKLSGLFSMLSTRSFYETKSFESILKELVGESTLIETAVETDSKIILTSSLVSVHPPQPFIFRNYNHKNEKDSKYEGSSREKLWRAARASSAAPGYFDEVVLDNGNRLVDGGILYNNPTPIALHEAKILWPNHPIDLVLSVGTGKPSPKEVPSSLFQMFTMIVDSATETEKTSMVLNDLLPKDTYFRLQACGNAYDFPLDETNTDKILGIEKEVEAYIKENEETFQKIAKILEK